GRDGARDAGRTFSYRMFRTLGRGTRTLSDLFASAPLKMNVDADGQPMPTAAGQLVSGNYFLALGVPAALGRTILPEDAGPESAHNVATISDSYWQRRFGGDPAVVGRVIRVNGYPVTI